MGFKLVSDIYDFHNAGLSDPRIAVLSRMNLFDIQNDNNDNAFDNVDIN